MVSEITPRKAGNRAGTKQVSEVTITAAGDFGYSLAQLYGAMFAINEPSYYIRQGLIDLPDVPDQGVFTYISGPASELIGKHIAVGSAAYAIDPINCQRNSDDQGNKLDSSLIMALGLLTYHKGLPDTVTVNLLTCLQRVTKELRRQAIDRLSGIHEIKCGRRIHSITIQPLGCGDEGVGVLLDTPDIDAAGNIVVLSIGGGTINVSNFYNKKLVSQQPFSMGVSELYEMLALSPTITSKLGSSGADAHVIRRGVERRDFFYGTSADPDRFSFEDEYKELLKSWFSKAFLRPLQAAKKRLKEADAGLVFGGGAKLPGISPLLERHGFTVVEDPVNANVKGLYAIAKALVSRGD